jgi:hypothetical protein
MFQEADDIRRAPSFKNARNSHMELLKSWVKPAFFLLVWIAVWSFTLSMVATVEPTLRALGQQS